MRMILESATFPTAAGKQRRTLIALVLCGRGMPSGSPQIEFLVEPLDGEEITLLETGDPEGFAFVHLAAVLSPDQEAEDVAELIDGMRDRLASSGLAHRLTAINSARGTYLPAGVAGPLAGEVMGMIADRLQRSGVSPSGWATATLSERMQYRVGEGWLVADGLGRCEFRLRSEAAAFEFVPAQIPEGMVAARGVLVQADPEIDRMLRRSIEEPSEAPEDPVLEEVQEEIAESLSETPEAEPLPVTPPSFGTRWPWSRLEPDPSPDPTETKDEP